jgi:hypothetical protein
MRAVDSNLTIGTASVRVRTPPEGRLTIGPQLNKLPHSQEWLCYNKPSLPITSAFR